MELTVVIPVTHNTPYLNASLRSIRYDYDGEIILVEDGDESDERCKGIARTYDATYIKNDRWRSILSSILIGARSCTTDIVMFSHSDIMFPPGWYDDITDMWYNADERIGMLNTQYYGFFGNVNAYGRELFISGKYSELLDHLQTYHDTRKILNSNPDRYGIARFEHVDPNKYKIANAISQCFTIRGDILRAMDDIDTCELPYTIIMELIRLRLWDITASTLIYLHAQGIDRSIMYGKRKEETGYGEVNFIKRYGFSSNYVVEAIYSDVYINNSDAIIEHSNNKTLYEIDYLFDEMDGKFHKGGHSEP